MTRKFPLLLSALFIIFWACAHVHNLSQGPREPAAHKIPSSKKVAWNRKGNTLIIGDSLSAWEAGKGHFGPGLCLALASAGGEACLFSISNSSFDQWAPVPGGPQTKKKWTLEENHNGSTLYRCSSRRGNDKKPSDIPDFENIQANLSLDALLKSNGQGCSDEPFKNVVVQLGTNPVPGHSAVPFMHQIISIANDRGVESISFVLPPNGYNNLSKFSALNAEAAQYLLEFNNPRVGYYNSSTEIRIENSDFRTYRNKKTGELSHDPDHFWNSASEITWIKSVCDYFEVQYPGAPQGG